MSLAVQILTPEGVFLETTTEVLRAPGVNGFFGVMSRHAPLVCALRRGIVTLHAAGQDRIVVLTDGLAEVERDHATLLVAGAWSASSPVDAERKLLEMESGCRPP